MRLRVFVPTMLVLFFLMLPMSAHGTVIASSWYNTYGMIYEGAQAGLRIGDTCQIARSGKAIGVFALLRVDDNNSTGIFTPDETGMELKQGDTVDCQKAPTTNKGETSAAVGEKTSPQPAPKSRPVEPVGYSLHGVAETGYFLPSEGGLKGGILVGGGARYFNEDNTLLLDFMVASTGAKAKLPALKGDVRHTLGQLGYLRTVGPVRLGGAVQYHSMNLKGITRLNKTTFSLIGEYDITDRVVLRLQTSAPSKVGTVHMGADMMTIVSYIF